MVKVGGKLNGDELILMQGLPLDEDLTEADVALLKRYSRSFTGSYSHSLDGKGRMVVPQSFRERLGDKFCVAPSKDFQSIGLYSNIAWARLRDRYARLAPLNRELVEFEEQFDAFSFFDQECDSQGRILLPAKIRNYFLGDERDVEITGARDHVRVVAASRGADQFARFRDRLPDILAEIGRLDTQRAQETE